MKRFHLISRLLIVSMLLLANVAYSQAETSTISISPLMPSVPLGGTVQFAANVTGLSNPIIAWSSGGAVGGNAKAGTISASGSYQAPATMPGQNPVQITASATINGSKKSATTYVYLLILGPTIASVSPNPLPVGSYVVTIKGSGFLTGATAIQSYGGNNIQLSTVSVTSDTLKANIYQGPAVSATFTVKNPGSAYSNAITVPVTGGSPPPATYALTVKNGTGSRNYAAGTVVTITANAPPSGQSFMNWTGATVQNPNASTTTLAMPASNATVTANYATSNVPPPVSYALTVQNGTGSGTYAAGTVVTIKANAPPAGQSFKNWTGATVQDPNASTTTLTMTAAITTVTANFVSNAVAIPYPVSGHPRIWITQNDLPRLRSWAVSSNPIYQQGIVPLLNQAVNAYNAQFFPNGVSNPNYPDPGDTQGYSGLLTEEYGSILAFNSLIDPNPANRIQYAKDARNLLMHAMNQAVLGHQSGAPFRDPMFAVYNHANGSGENWPLIVDWIYNAVDGGGNPILTAADKKTIRDVFLIWANDCINASTTGGDHPSPLGATNSLQLLPNNQPYRYAANNYYLGHARLLTMMALSIDPGDDPLIDNSAPASQLGNTLRSYIPDATGAWLYQEFAMFGDPSAVASAYGIPGNGAGFGLANGGLPPEGMLYGHSYAYLLGQLLALQTAGFNNPAYAGPQIQLISSPIWDRFVTGYFSSLVPTAKTFAEQPWLGPVYQYGSYGDLLRLWVTPDFMQPFALLSLLEGENNNKTHLDAARWFAVNAVEGGPNALLSRVTSPWSYGSMASLLYFMLLDPSLPAASDPRPTYSATFYDPGAGRIVAHSDWSANGTMFDYRASWLSINHQDGDGGQFELYRKGEWLTKEMSNYDNNAVGLTTVYHNTLALQNWCANGTPSLQWFESGEWNNGSQWMLGANAGDPVTHYSSGSGYVYATSDLTPLYNRPIFWTPSDGATDISQATRSIIWLNGDYIVVYDRAASLHSGLFKRFNLCLTNPPAITAHGFVETLDSGQRLYGQTLLPANPSIKAAFSANNLNPIAQLESTRYILTAEDPTKPADVRFLNVLQGADAGASEIPATYLKSSLGTAFDGAAFGSTAVFFPVSASASFAATTFSVPSGVHTAFVAGLSANASYGVSVQAVVGGNAIVIAPGGASATTDSAGALKLTF